MHVRGGGTPGMLDTVFWPAGDCRLEVWAAPGAQETLPKGGGAKPATFWNGFPSPRGRPDPQHRRSPVGLETMCKKTQVYCLGLVGHERFNKMNKNLELGGLIICSPRVAQRRTTTGPAIQPHLANNEITQPLVLCIHLGDHVVTLLQRNLREVILLTFLGDNT